MEHAIAPARIEGALGASDLWKKMSNSGDRLRTPKRSLKRT
jgi:hypothetical protein